MRRNDDERRDANGRGSDAGAFDGDIFDLKKARFLKIFPDFKILPFLYPGCFFETGPREFRIDLVICIHSNVLGKVVKKLFETHAS